MVVHVGDKENTRISIIKVGSILNIKGYCCKKGCEKCSLYKVGEPMEKINYTCEKLDEDTLVMSLKVDSTLIEGVSFV